MADTSNGRHTTYSRSSVYIHGWFSMLVLLQMDADVRLQWDLYLSAMKGVDRDPLLHWVIKLPASEPAAAGVCRLHSHHAMMVGPPTTGYNLWYRCVCVRSLLKYVRMYVRMYTPASCVALGCVLCDCPPQPPFSHRAKSPWWHGIARLHAHVLQPGHTALARPQGSHQEAEVQEDQREEDIHSGGGAVQRVPQWVPWEVEGSAIQ